MLLMNSMNLQEIGYFVLFDRTGNENGALITLYAKGGRDNPYKLFLIHDQWPLKMFKYFISTKFIGTEE